MQVNIWEFMNEYYRKWYRNKMNKKQLNEEETAAKQETVHFLLK